MSELWCVLLLCCDTFDFQSNQFFAISTFRLSSMEFNIKGCCTIFDSYFRCKHSPMKTPISMIQNKWKHFFIWNDSRIMIFIRRSKRLSFDWCALLEFVYFCSLCVSNRHQTDSIKYNWMSERVSEWTSHKLHIFAFAILCVISNVRIWHLWYT